MQRTILRLLLWTAVAFALLALLAVNYRGAIAVAAAAALMLAAVGITRRVFFSDVVERLFDIAEILVLVIGMGAAGYFAWKLDWLHAAIRPQSRVRSVTWTDVSQMTVASVPVLARVPSELGYIPPIPGKVLKPPAAGGGVWSVIDPRPSRDDTVQYELAGYAAIVQPSDSSLRSFALSEHYVVERRTRRSCASPPGATELMSCPAVVDTVTATAFGRKLRSTAAGFALRELRVGALPVEQDGTLTLPLSRDILTTVRLRPGRPIATRAEVRELPLNSFYLTKDAQRDSVQITAYVHTQKVAWEPVDLREGAIFSFIPTPFNHARWLIHPVLGASTFSDWIIGLIALGMMAGGWVVKAKSADWLKLARWTGGRRESQNGTGAPVTYVRRAPPKRRKSRARNED